MSNIQLRDNFTPEQMTLLTNVIAKGATKDELNLFLYRCKSMGIDPLRPGHIYFVKYGTGPGSIVIGREEFRSRAAKTGKHSGTKVGLIKDATGKCNGAWSEVFRTDWQHPAREEVSMSEYNTGKSNWAKMPETMIKKVAEVAALRMAFPDECGGLYSEDEMEQAKIQDAPKTEAPKAVDTTANETPAIEATLCSAGDEEIRYGYAKGKLIRDVGHQDLRKTLAFIESKNIQSEAAIHFVKNVTEYFAELEHQDMDAQFTRAVGP